MKKILLASAYDVFLRKNKELLMFKEIQLYTSLSGSEALKLNKEHSFDLIFVDSILADMSGISLCSLVHKEENARDIPVILACQNIKECIDRAKQSSAVAMLIKPVDPINILKTIGSFIDLDLCRSIRAKLNVKVLSKKQNLDFYCYSKDISSTGILLETELELLIGSSIYCQFTLPHSRKIETEGKVIRYMIGAECKNLYGIKFIDLASTYQRVIDNYINSIANSGYNGMDA
jgi:CheY-like chemotaxis protein